VLQSEHATRRFEKAKAYLRLFMRDTAQLNRLIRKEESDDIMFQFAIDMAISDWNSTNPIIAPVSIGNYPSLYLLLHGGAIQLLKSQGLLQSRNELTYTSGGSSLIRSNKTQYYQSWLMNFGNEYSTKVRNMKLQMNVAQGWGGVVSEYDLIGYSW
jgi:hypothetical protein